MHFLHNKSEPYKKNLCKANSPVFNWYFFVQCIFLPHARTDFLTRIVVIVVVELVCVRSTKNNVKAVVVEVIGVVVEREVEIIVGIEVPVDLVNGLVLCRTLYSRACSNK